MLAAPGLAAEGDPPPEPESVNAAPEAVDDTATVTSGESVVVPVLSNDFDPDASSSTSLSLLGVSTPPASGAAAALEAGIEYTPNTDFVGQDAFTYRVSDGELDAEATVTITVTAVPNTAPQTRGDRASTHWGSPVVADVADCVPRGMACSAYSR